MGVNDVKSGTGNHTPDSADQANDVLDSQEPSKLGRFTWPQITWFLVVWLALFALGTLFVANPFWNESSASANPNYGHLMYFHSVLVGLAAVVVLVACEVFKLRSTKVRTFVLAAAVGSTVIVGLGGIFDATTQVNWFWLILHIIGFFLLDAIFVAFLVGLYVDRRSGSKVSRGLPFWTAVLSAISLELAALMGHAAGWLIDFGNHPALIGMWAKLMGESVSDFTGNLVTGHSHEMVAGLLALLIAMVAWRFGYQALEGGAKMLAQIGLWFVMAGTAIMTIIYVVGGFTAIEPPNLFTFGPGGVNGLASDDLVTGIGIMIGGLFVLLALWLAKQGFAAESDGLTHTLFAIAWSWLLLVVTVVGAGYYIELHETVFGAGDPHASGAVSDAVFTFAHQDFAFFLLPALITVLLITSLVVRHSERMIARGFVAGTFITFIGVLTYIFADPTAIYGPGYIVTAIGTLVVFITVILFLKGLWRVAFPDSHSSTPGVLEPSTKGR